MLSNHLISNLTEHCFNVIKLFALHVTSFILRKLVTFNFVAYNLFSVALGPLDAGSGFVGPMKMDPRSCLIGLLFCCLSRRRCTLYFCSNELQVDHYARID